MYRCLETRQACLRRSEAGLSSKRRKDHRGLQNMLQSVVVRGLLHSLPQFVVVKGLLHSLPHFVVVRGLLHSCFISWWSTEVFCTVCDLFTPLFFFSESEILRASFSLWQSEILLLEMGFLDVTFLVLGNSADDDNVACDLKLPSWCLFFARAEYAHISTVVLLTCSIRCPPRGKPASVHSISRKSQPRAHSLPLVSSVVFDF